MSEDNRLVKRLKTLTQPTHGGERLREGPALIDERLHLAAGQEIRVRLQELDHGVLDSEGRTVTRSIHFFGGLQ